MGTLHIHQVYSISGGEKLRCGATAPSGHGMRDEKEGRVTFSRPPAKGPWWALCGPVSNRGENLLADRGPDHVNIGKDRVTTLCPMDSDGNLELLMARYQEGDFDAATAL